MQFFRNPLRSAPFEEYLDALQRRLRDQGVMTKVFRSRLYHQWFLCVWSARRRRRLKNCAKKYDAVIVLGCASATETVRNVVDSTDVKVIEGMTPTGIMNARLKLEWPGKVFFEDSTVVPMSAQTIA
jgi:Asp/Glu/hydantoin racemase